MTYLTPKEDNTVKKSLLPRKKKKSIKSRSTYIITSETLLLWKARNEIIWRTIFHNPLTNSFFFFSNLPYLLLYHISHILSIHWYTTIKPFSISKGIFFLKPWGNIQFLPSTLSISILQAKRGLEVYNESSSGKGLMSLQEEKELLKTTIKLNLWRCIRFSLSKH